MSSSRSITELRRFRTAPTLFPAGVNRLGALVREHQSVLAGGFIPAALALVAELLDADAVAWSHPADGQWEVAQVHVPPETMPDAAETRDLCRALAVLTEREADDTLQIEDPQRVPVRTHGVPTGTTARASVGVLVRRADGEPAGVLTALYRYPHEHTEGTTAWLLLVGQSILHAGGEHVPALEYPAGVGMLSSLAFGGYLTRAMVAQSPQRDPFALLCVGVDGIGGIVETLGQEAGEEVQRVVGVRLLRRLRETDVVARYADLTFAALLRGVAKADDATRVATDLVTNATTPIAVSGREVLLAVHIGIALAPSTGGTAEGIQATAHGALAVARQLGQGGIHIAVGA